jgi:hypothetical protein
LWARSWASRSARSPGLTWPASSRLVIGRREHGERDLWDSTMVESAGPEAAPPPKGAGARTVYELLDVKEWESLGRPPTYCLPDRRRPSNRSGCSRRTGRYPVPNGLRHRSVGPRSQVGNPTHSASGGARQAHERAGTNNVRSTTPKRARPINDLWAEKSPSGPLAPEAFSRRLGDLVLS